MRLEDIIRKAMKEMLEESDSETCGCGCCALQRAAGASDSKDASKKLSYAANMLDAVRTNVRNLGASIDDEGGYSEELAQKLITLGYHYHAAMVRRYTDFAKECVNLYKDAAEETARKEKELIAEDKKSAQEAAQTN